MTSIRIAIATIAIAATGLAQAQEATQWTLEKGTASRAAVAAEARNAPSTNEVYAGPGFNPATGMSVKSREEVRTELAASLRMRDRAAATQFVGGV